MNPSFNNNLAELIDACSQGDRHSQKMLYQHFYSYAMSICLRYAADKEEAQEILNDGFLKVFTKLHAYDRAKPFQMWLRRIMINTCIDYYRKRKRALQHVEVDKAYQVKEEANVLDEISAQEILNLVQELPPSYRLVFNLYVIEGYKHEEIAEQLGIHVGTSKSNLAKARKHLKRMFQNLQC